MHLPPPPTPRPPANRAQSRCIQGATSRERICFDDSRPKAEKKAEKKAPEPWRTVIVVPPEVINLPISPAAFSLYVRSFLRHRNAQTGTAWMGWDSMLRESGVGTNTLKKRLLELESFGLITLLGKKGPTNEYRVHVSGIRPPGIHENVNPATLRDSQKREPSDSQKRESWDSRNRESNHKQGTISKEPPPTTTTTVETAVPAAAGVSRESGGGEVRSGSGSAKAVALMASAWPGSIRPDEREKAERELDGVATPSAESVEAVKAYYASDSPNKAYSFTQFARTWHRQVIDARAWQATLTPSIESYRERIAREDARVMAQAEARRRAPVEDPIPPGELIGSFMAIIRQQKSLEGHPEEPEPFLAS